MIRVGQFRAFFRESFRAFFRAFLFLQTPRSRSAKCATVMPSENAQSAPKIKFLISVDSPKRRADEAICVLHTGDYAKEAVQQMMRLREPRKDLPEIPSRMRSLPIEERGYPVPWFVEWIEGRPDFRVMDRRKWGLAIRFGNCWLCGEPVGVRRTFVIGPMCGINRTTSEPANHLECAQFAALACPFMTRPHAKYRTANLPEGHIEAAGLKIDRNPGVTCLWTTREFSVFRAFAGRSGQLIRLGEPTSVEWYTEGRPATREEVWHSVETGLPLLEKSAREQDAEEHRADCVPALQAKIREFEQYLPAEAA